MKPARNAPCGCRSGKRFKDCCGRLAGAPASAARETAPAADLARLGALLQAGRYADLARGARHVIDAHPDSGLAWQCLGLALRGQGHDALPAMARAAALLPDDAGAHTNHGNALARAGELEPAMACYRRAIAIDPYCAEAHRNLAQAEFDLGNGRLARARPEEALACFRRALAIEPDLAEAHHNAGNALFDLGRLDEALASYREALRLNPRLATAHANLATVLRNLGHLEEAIAAYRRALDLAPDSGDALANLATALRLQGHGEEAERTCRRALEQRPSGAAWGVLAEIHADHGRMAEAEAAYRHALELDPDAAEAWAGLARMRRMTRADAAWLQAAERIAERPLAPRRRAELQYAIGKYFDDVGDVERAFHHYRLANELKKRSRAPFDRQRLTREVDELIARHDAASLRAAAAGAPRSARPVFIVGMLRSGTSLAEHMLAAHPAVHGAGELPFWSAAARLPGHGPAYLELLDGLAPAAARVIDKMPANFLWLGPIHAALPAARIIHLERDPRDTCLSIYFQHLETSVDHANDLGDLAFYYREYRRVMQHWRSVLPPQALLEVPYEGLVGDPERWIRRMLEFIGLPWDPRCLEFHSSGRAVLTASKWQVRQPVNGASVGRWRRYAQFLGPLLDLRARPASGGV